MLRFALALLVVSVSVAHAGPPTEEPPSRGVAVMLSVGTTLGGLWMLTSAERAETALLGSAVMVVGPSTGRWYASEASLSGIGLRAAAATVVFYGLESDQTALLIGGSALWIGSALVDVLLADRAARDYNARHLSVRPTLQSSTGGATGLALTGSF